MPVNRLQEKVGRSSPPGIILIAGGLILAYEWALLISTIFAPGSIGPNFLGVGTDWMVFHGAADMFLRGDLTILYDGVPFTDRINEKYARYLSEPMDYRQWANPPSFLLLLAPFAALSFIPSLLAMLLLQMLMLGRAVYKISLDGFEDGKGAIAIAVCFLSPAFAYNALCGQVAPFACALVIITLCCAKTRPVLAGLALALLSVKPQYGIAVTAFLVAGGYFRALAWAMSAGVGLVAASLAVVGLQPWLEWAELALNGLVGRGDWNDAARLWGNSVYACLVASGFPPPVATAAQVASTLGSIVASVLIALKDTCEPRRIAAIMLLTLVAAPYYGAYDTVLATTALAIVYAKAPELMPKSVAGWSIPLLVWAIPFYSPPIVNPAGRLTPLFLIAAIAQLYLSRRARELPVGMPAAQIG